MYACIFVVVQSLSRIQLFQSMDCSNSGSSSSSISQSLLKFMFIESVMLSNHLILCCLQSFPASQSFSKSWLFVSGGQSIGASASASVFPSEYSGLISFRIDWLDLLAVQGAFKSSPTPHFKSINSLALIFLYGPTLTSIHDY